MKKTNYLLTMIRPLDPNQRFLLSRGEAFPVEGLTGLAIVRASDPDNSLSFNGDWSIIDIASGLFIFSARSKKKLLEIWNERYNDCDYDLIGKIERSRTSPRYKKKVEEKEQEAYIWRKSGYVIEGIGIEKPRRGLF